MDALVDVQLTQTPDWRQVMRRETAAMAVQAFERRWSRADYAGYRDETLLQLAAELREYVVMRRIAEGRVTG